jgi:tetratricopeptide (TPR) repeat protein
LIEHVLANPNQTSGDELFRNGSYALAEGWLQDAVTDLERAVAQFRYNPAWWFNLAVARERSGASANAAEAFAHCAQYGARQAPVMAATAVLIAAGLYRRLHEVERSAEVLLQYIEPLAACAELHLALAVHHGRADLLTTAFALAPGLVVDARAAGLADVTETAAAAVCARPDSPVGRLSALNGVINQLVQAIQDADLPPGPDVDPHPHLPPAGGDALLLAQAGLSMAAERAHRRPGGARRSAGGRGIFPRRPPGRR